MKKNTSKNAKGILLLAFLLFAVVLGALVFRKYETATRKVEPAPQAAPAGTVVVNLFFGASDGEGLVREGREVDIEDSLEASVESVVDELISGPVGNLGATVPANAKVLGVRVKGDVAEIDFGPEFLEGIPAGSSAEMTAVYSVVDTVTVNFPRIKAVQFLVAGAVPETLKGHVDLSLPLNPDLGLEKKEGGTPEQAATPGKPAKQEPGKRAKQEPAKRD